MDSIDEIRRHIAESGLKSPTIEARTGHIIRRATVEKIIAGRTRNPGIDTVRAIGGVLGLTVSELIGEEDPPRELGRSPCRDWDEVRRCLVDLGMSEVAAGTAIIALRAIALDSKAPGGRAATG
jgi:hypothetical protein